MKTIHPIPPSLVSKIAAGEVIERPLSVMKELVENAIDAGATHISVRIENGGMDSIRVRDNGVGMSEEDLLLCWHPHTTSKLLTEEDLSSIRTMGFRGEALASIATVSDMTIASRQAVSDAGAIIELTRDTAPHVQPFGMSPGTEITVDHLFVNLPARRAFFKDTRGEMIAISERMTHYALAYPSIGFSLHSGNRPLMNVPENQTKQERLATLLGDDRAHHFIPIEHKTSYGRLSGWIGAPQIATRRGAHQYLFVNGRTIENSPLKHAIKDAYATLLEARALPSFILFLVIPYESVDVNIHPRKTEVAFVYPKEIEQLVTEGVQQVIQQADVSHHRLSHDRSASRPTAAFLKGIHETFRKNEKSEILQIDNLYLVTPHAHGLLVIDQHAAHERVLFEEFQKAARVSTEEGKHISPIDEPVIFDLSPSEIARLDEKSELLSSLGFTIELFGPTSWRISAVPTLFAGRDYAQLVRELLNEQGDGENLDRITERTLTFLACRAAVKAGDVLTPEMRLTILESLLISSNPYTCPHGRSTYMEVQKEEIDQFFKRR